jgi:hypothetical protein
LVGGNNVSRVSVKSIVDLESNLFGIDRESSRCAQSRYLPGEVQGKSTFKPVCYKKIDMTPNHLRHCQFANFPAVPNAPEPDIFKCGR